MVINDQLHTPTNFIPSTELLAATRYVGLCGTEKGKILDLAWI
jgi:hypothetical protein